MRVTLFDYLAIPAIAGAGITLASFLLSVLLVRRNDKQTESGRPTLRDWLQRPIVGAGAWTANDSWATNITTGLVIVSTFLASIPATDALLPNGSLIRFSLVNVAAGVFAAAAPVVFGILYSRYTMRNPGLMAEATVELPWFGPAAISVPSGASIVLAADTVVAGTTQAGRSPCWVKVRAGGSYQIPPQTSITVFTVISAVARNCAEQGQRVAPAEIAKVGGRADNTNLDAEVCSLTLAVEQAFARVMPEPQTVLAGSQAALVQDLQRALADGSVQAAVTDLVASAARPRNPRQAQRLTTAVPSIIEAMQEEARQIARPAPEGALAYAGGADIAILPGTVICPSAPADTAPVTWTVAAGDILAKSAGQPHDVPLTQPVFIDAAGGAKITVTGAADINLATKAVIKAPRRRDYPLPRPRQLMAPQSGNLIVADLGIILTVNLLTMFGIGAELGIGGVVAGFSQLNPTGLGLITAALAVIAVMVIVYAGTATRAIADPQPGSSMSSQSGASFTL